MASQQDDHAVKQYRIVDCGFRIGEKKHKAGIAEANFWPYALLFRRKAPLNVYNETDYILDSGCFSGLESTQNWLG
jgi:hypothetical protein